MTDGDGAGEWGVSGVSRRGFLSTTAVAGGAAAVGVAAGQEDDDGGSSAVNVGDAEGLDSADEVTFDREMPVATLNQLFIEHDTPRHPVVGTEIGFDGLVLNRVDSEDVRSALSGGLDWETFETEGDRLLSPLFDPVSWVRSGRANVPESFFEEYALVRLVGVEQADQRFYDKYSFPPYVWGVVRASEAPESGTLVRAAGRVAYAGGGGIGAGGGGIGTGGFGAGGEDGEDGAETPSSTGAETRTPFDFSGAGGVYLRVSSLQRTDRTTTLSSASGAGERASVTGLQRRASPQLTTERLDVEYSYESEFPRPTGGSVVGHQGQVEAASVERGPAGSATIRTSNQSIVVGDTRPGRWDSEGETATPEEGRERTFTNTVAVLDTSGSMSDRDTRSGESRLTVAKQATRSLVNYVGSGNQLGITSFDDRAREVAPLRTVDDEARESMRTAIDDLFADGGTSIGAGLQQALAMLRGVQGPKSIILMSDGQQNEPPRPAEILPELKSLGVTIYTIGMGSSAARETLARLADETGGEMRFRPEPGDIRTLFQNFAIAAQNWSKLTSERERMEEGDTVTGSATVDGSCDEVQFSLSYPGSTITLQPTRPDGTDLSETADGVTHRVGATNEVWIIEEPETGDWEFTMTGEELERPETASAEVSADSPIGAQLFVDDLHYDQTGMYRVELKATRERERYTGADVTLTAEHEGTTETISLRDDRGGPDPVADDGIYTGYFHPEETGEYAFTASISGGEQAGLQRDFSRRLNVETVVEEPIRPYREREPVSQEEDDDSADTPTLLERAEQYAPVGAAATGVVLLLGVLKRRLG